MVVTGVADIGTWMSALTSAGDPYRPALAADCATILDTNTANTLISNSYQIIGRYLTGTANGVSKALTHAEIDIIFAAGLRFFPIYQTSGNNLSYFNSNRGISDAKAAYEAALALGIPFQTIIYFAVDFDAIDANITNAILPYFQAVKSNLSGYRVGIYGARNVCRRVAAAGYSVSSFVSGMSTGFSGNLGFAIPDDWAFDQFANVTIGSGAGALEIDKVAYSGRNSAIRTLGFTIQPPDNTTLVNIPADQVPSTQIPLEYVRNQSSTWIYCNYPEQIQYNSDKYPDDQEIALADDNIPDAGYFLNHLTVTTGTHRIFYSYQDERFNGPFTLAIKIHNPIDLLYNPNGDPINVTVNHWGHKSDLDAPQGVSSTWNWMAGEVWRDFIFVNSPINFAPIAIDTDVWITKNVDIHAVFSGNFDFTLTGHKAEITIMAYKDQDHIKANLSAFPIVIPVDPPVPLPPNDPRYYSGFGNGYISRAKPITLKVSELTNGKYFLMNYKDSFTDLVINSENASSDLISITHVTNGVEYSAVDNANLGNWSAQNLYTLTLQNDTLQTARIGGYVRADLAPPPLDIYSGMVVPIITTGNQFEYAHLDKKPENGLTNSWLWLSELLEPGDTITGTIQFILGTNSVALQKMIFKLLSV